MTPIEHAAFTACIRHAADMALVAALTLEIRPDARHVRQTAAIAALRGLAEALKDTAGSTTSDATVEKDTRFVRTPAEGLHSPQPVASRETARAAGYTGDPCTSCHSFTVKRSGTCAVCETCGATTGCS